MSRPRPIHARGDIQETLFHRSVYHRGRRNHDLFHGRQRALFNIPHRSEVDIMADPANQTTQPRIAIYCENKLVAVACQSGRNWQLERVFTQEI